jgi:hypothetical protein
MSTFPFAAGTEGLAVSGKSFDCAKVLRDKKAKRTEVKTESFMGFPSTRVDAPILTGLPV